MITRLVFSLSSFFGHCIRKVCYIVNIENMLHSKIVCYIVKQNNLCMMFAERRKKKAKYYCGLTSKQKHQTTVSQSALLEAETQNQRCS